MRHAIHPPVPTTRLPHRLGNTNLHQGVYLNCTLTGENRCFPHDRTSRRVGAGGWACHVDRVVSSTEPCVASAQIEVVLQHSLLGEEGTHAGQAASSQEEGSGKDLGSTRRSPPPGETRQAADHVSSRGTSRWCPPGRPRWPAGKKKRKHESIVNMLVRITCDTVPRFKRCAEKNGASRRQTEAWRWGGSEQGGAVR